MTATVQRLLAEHGITCSMIRRGDCLLRRWCCALAAISNARVCWSAMRRTATWLATHSKPGRRGRMRSDPAATDTRATAARVVRQNGRTPRPRRLGCATRGAATALACCPHRNDLDDARRLTRLAGFGPQTVFRGTARLRPLTWRPDRALAARTHAGQKRRFIHPTLHADRP